MKKRYEYIAIFIIALINIPFLFSDGDMFIGASWDFLDSSVVWFKLLVENNYLFESNNCVVSQLMNMPRIALGNEFSLFVFLVQFLGIYKAFALNILIQQLIAFIGLFKLNEYLFFRIQQEAILNVLISFSFAMLNFWEAGGIGLAGLPYLLYLVLVSINRKPKWFEWLFIFIYPFYSNFFLSGVFVIFSLIVTLFYLKKKHKRDIQYPLIFVFLICLLSVFINYRFFIELLSPSFVHHRVEFHSLIGFKDAFKKTIYSFILGQGHSPSLHTFVILPFTALMFVYLWIKKRIDKPIIILVTTILLIAILDGFIDYAPVVSFKKKIPILNSFQVDRFYLFYPLLWYSLFAYLIKKCLTIFNLRYSSKWLLFIICSNLVAVLIRSVVCIGLVDAYLYDIDEVFTFNEFYAEPAFDKIKKYINDDSKVFSVGLEPSIALYNNLSTIDGYSSFYKLDYKHSFRKIISKELEKNEKNRAYFDNWGSRCYVFDDELGRNFNYNKYSNEPKIIDLDLNYQHLNNLGCGYFISTIEVKKNENIELVYSCEDDIRYYYLYRIKNDIRL